MISVRTGIEIARPVEDVFAYVADVAREPEWHVDAVEIRVEPAGPLQSGSVLHGTYRTMGRAFTGVADVVDFEPPALIRYRFREPAMGLRPTITQRFEATDGGARYSRHIEMETMGPTKLMEPILRRVAPRRNAMFLRNLKRRLEAAS